MRQFYLYINKFYCEKNLFFNAERIRRIMKRREDIYNVAKSKKYYSKGDLVATRTIDANGNTTPIEELPLGKYIVKEDKASKGYLLDNTEYEVTLEYKDQYTKVIANKTTSNELVKKKIQYIVLNLKIQK